MKVTLKVSTHGGLWVGNYWIFLAVPLNCCGLWRDLSLNCRGEYLAHPEVESIWYFGIHLISVLKHCSFETLQLLPQKVENRAVCCGARVECSVSCEHSNYTTVERWTFLSICLSLPLYIVVLKGLLCIWEWPNSEELRISYNRKQHKTRWRARLPGPDLIQWVLMSGIGCGAETCTWSTHKCLPTFLGFIMNNEVFSC